MDTHELAWAAGFFDGEGCTSITRSGPTKWPCVTLKVAQTERTSLERMQRALGFGTIIGPFDRSKYSRNSKPIYHFCVGNFEQAQAGVALMWRWLGSPKRRQATERLRAVSDWETGRTTSPVAKARSARSRRLTGERSCAKAGHPKPNKGRCMPCEMERRASEEYRKWNREHQRDLRIANPEKIRAIGRKASAKRRATNPDAVRAYANAYYAKNRDRLRSYHRAYDAKKRAEKKEV